VISAFITFKTEDGYNEAIRCMENPTWYSNKHELLGSKIKIEPADEPGNIIWENKHVKGLTFLKRVIIGISAVSIMLLISFSIIIYL
jgi:hypothetical protein